MNPQSASSAAIRTLRPKTDVAPRIFLPLFDFFLSVCIRKHGREIEKKVRAADTLNVQQLSGKGKKEKKEKKSSHRRSNWQRRIRVHYCENSHEVGGAPRGAEAKSLFMRPGDSKRKRRISPVRAGRIDRGNDRGDPPRSAAVRKRSRKRSEFRGFRFANV